MLEIAIILLNFIIGSILIVTGVKTMGSTLENAHSNILRKTMRLFSRNELTSFLAGIFMTGLVQSSTAVTILTVGFVDSGIMSLESAVGIIYGANIGTTLTAQFMSFNITRYAWYILIAGCIFSFGPIKKLKTAGDILIGVGLLFSGLDLMGKSVGIIKGNALLAGWLQGHSNNIFLCLFAGLIITALVQSSSATVGMTILLFNSGLLPFTSAVALTLGDNIGSCVTAQIASLKSGIAGKRTAWAHTIYNVFGVILALVTLPQFCFIVQECTRLLGQGNSRLIANTHTIFNLLSAVLFIPISRHYVRLLEYIIPDKKQSHNTKSSPKSQKVRIELHFPHQKFKSNKMKRH